MSLDYDLSKVKDWKSFALIGDKFTAEAESIIFATMAVDIGHITEKNYIEFSMRCQVVAGLTEFPGSREAFFQFTPEVVKKYIGLRTNVINKPLASWFKRQFDNSMMTASYNERRREQQVTSGAAV